MFKVNDQVFVIHNKRPVQGKIIAMRSGNAIVDAGGDDYRWVREDDIFTDRVTACVKEATWQRKCASSARKTGLEKLEEAQKYEDAAIELLAEANAILRRKA